MIIQFSQIGVFIFMAYNFLAPKHVPLVGIIYFIFIIGLVSYIPLAYLWNKTQIIANEKRSIWLYVFTFSLGILDSTSTVTFLPYIGKYYRKEYIVSNGIGETLAAMLPSLLALIQGIGKNENNEFMICLNKTQESIELNDYIEPKLSVGWFFIILFLILLISFNAFSLLHFGKIGKSIRKPEQQAQQQQQPQSQQISKRNDFDNLSYTSFSSLLDSQTHTITTIPITEEIPLGKRDLAMLQIINFIVSILIFGIFPAIQSYATLPYGTSIYYLTINLTNILLPFIVFISIISFNISNQRLITEFLIGILLTVYIVFSAYLSPCPPLAQTKFGSILITLCWITTCSLFIRIRCLVATKLEHVGHDTLINFGILTSIGQIFGGSIAFILVNVIEIFDHLPSCKTTDQFCFK